MNEKDLQYFKDKLLKEKTVLEEELSTVGRKNPNSPGDWEATVNDDTIDSADENEVADIVEELDEHKAILSQLETQLHEVNHALAKIELGTYGICEETNVPIERERLEANPSARTAIKR